MNAINFTVPYLISLVLNDPLTPLVLNEVTLNFQEMEIDYDGTSSAVLGLKADTSDDVIQQVKSYVLGETDFDITLVTEETLLSYLAAAKIVDLTIPAGEQMKSTITIRDACLAEPKALKSRKQISLLNAYIIPKLSETRKDFLNGYNGYPLDRDIRNEMQKFAETSAYFHRDALTRIETVFKRSLNAIATSTKLLKDRNIFFNGPSGVGKSTAITKFVTELAGKPMDLKDILYGTDNVMDGLQEQFPTCQKTPSFILGMALRHTLETAVKTHAIGNIFFLQEGVTERDEVALDLLNNTKQLEIRDFDAPFKTVAIRALNREFLRKQLSLDFDAFAKGAELVRKARITFLTNISENQHYEMNYNGAIYTAEDMKSFDYNETDLAAIGNELITEEEASSFSPTLDGFVGLTIRDAFKKVNELMLSEGT